MSAPSYTGKPADRVDGRAKVTGAAKYAAEYAAPDLAHGHVVSSAIARGRIVSIDAAEALRQEGVLHVFTHENVSGLAWFDRSYKDMVAPVGSPLRLLQSDEIRFSGQPIALVVARTLELARHAASLVRVVYAPEPHVTDLDAQRGSAREAPVGRAGYEPPPEPRGRPDEAFAAAAAQVEAEYATPVEHHNPMELFATTVMFEDDGTLTVHDKTQGVQNVQSYLTHVFGLPAEQVRVLSPFVGGAFGSGLRPQPQVFLAVLAALELKRHVRVELTRPQMFALNHRSQTRQAIRLGASADGVLQAIIHEAVAATSTFEDYTEVMVNWSAKLYQCESVRLGYRLATLDVNTPADMRAPGATQGIHALECAMDELAHALDMDPLALRLANHAEKDQTSDKPFSSKELRACYAQGAARFGWSRRTRAPRSMRDGDLLVGWGMATGTWDAMQGPASARAVLNLDGKLVVSSATADIGTGTYTIMTQIAAEALGLPLEDVTFKLGDSSLPLSLVEGGSWTAGSVGSAVKKVCDEIAARLFTLARGLDGSPLVKHRIEDVVFRDGAIQLRDDPTCRVTLAQAMRGGGVTSLEEKVIVAPDLREQSKYAKCTHSAVFVEVKVDEALGAVHVTRVVSAVAAGRILNPKTAGSQIMGGVIWGISMALQEESVLDHRLGRFMNHDLAGYHFPVNADIGAIDVIFVPEDDAVVNPLGVKGVGEIGLVGVAAAVANAVFHATGKRVRSLPITLDKLL